MLPFFFDSDTFELVVFQENEKCGCMDLNIISAFLKNIGDPRDHKWIKQVWLSGITSEGYRVIFDSNENFSTYNESRIFSVNWAYYYDPDRDINHINGFNVDGPVVERFYSPNRAFKSDIQYDSKTGGWTELAIKAIKPVVADGGSFELHWKEMICPGPQTAESNASMNTESSDKEQKGENRITNVKINLTAYANLNPLASTPLTTTSNIEFEYKIPVSLYGVIKTYRLVYNFFQYVSYCAIVNFDNLETYWFDEKGRKRYNGRLVRKPSDIQQTNEKSHFHKSNSDKKYIIGFDLLKEKTAGLFEVIESNKLSFDHLVTSVEARHSYKVARFITILTAFEREYFNLYGPDSLRDDEYKHFKESVVQKLNDERNDFHGKEKKWMKEFIKGIENRDDSYKSRVKNALIQNYAEIKPFIKAHYKYEAFEDAAEDISERIGNLRNGFAHNRLDLRLEPVHLIDIKIIEELLYCMRLKVLGLATPEIQQAVSDLMGEDIGHQ